MDGLIGNFGIPIYESSLIPDKVPVIELSEKVNVSPEFRVKTNAWYIEMFGYKSIAYVIEGGLVASPKVLAALRFK